MGSADNLKPETYGLFLDAMTISMTISLVMCIVGAITSAFRGIPKKS